jgi:hypothetical protein
MERLADKVPLSGAKLDAAIKAMESARFLERLTVRIMKLAAAKGFQSPFDEKDVDLPGGKSAADLAVDIIEKALDGTYTWDDGKQPDFYRFCSSRAESILSNWLEKNRRMTAMSPVIEEVDGEDPEHRYRGRRNIRVAAFSRWRSTWQSAVGGFRAEPS